jgi:hypothetical protein
MTEAAKAAVGVEQAPPFTNAVSRVVPIVAATKAATTSPAAVTGGLEVRSRMEGTVDLGRDHVEPRHEATRRTMILAPSGTSNVAPLSLTVRMYGGGKVVEVTGSVVVGAGGTVVVGVGGTVVATVPVVVTGAVTGGPDDGGLVEGGADDGGVVRRGPLDVEREDVGPVDAGWFVPAPAFPVGSEQLIGQAGPIVVPVAGLAVGGTLPVGPGSVRCPKPPAPAWLPAPGLPAVVVVSAGVSRSATRPADG